jgi:hypothetical protein
LKAKEREDGRASGMTTGRTDKMVRKGIWDKGGKTVKV